MRKAQAGTEYVILIGLLLVFLIPTIHYAYSQANLQIKVTQIENLINRLAKSADAVYAMGPGATEIVTIAIPAGVQSIVADKNEIVAIVTAYGGISEVHKTTIANVSGTITLVVGAKGVPVTMQPTGIVRIGEGPFISKLDPDYNCPVEGVQSFLLLGENFNPNLVVTVDLPGLVVFPANTQYCDPNKARAFYNLTTQSAQTLKDFGSQGNFYMVSLANPQTGEQSNRKIYRIDTTCETPPQKTC